MELYDKLYEAVSQGIHKALILPDENNDNDTSVIWRHKKITNNFDYYNNIVQLFLSDKNDNKCFEYYKEILDFYYKTDERYKVKSYKELTDIIFQIYHLFFYKHFQFAPYYMEFNFDWIDFESAGFLKITVINTQGNEKNYRDANTEFDFIKITCSKLTKGDHDNSIILHKDFFNKRYQLLTYMPSIPYLEKDIHSIYEIDYDGYADTEVYKNFLKKFKNYKLKTISPAMAYIKDCENKLKEVTNFKCSAYLPAAGQLQIICDLSCIINQVLAKMGGTPMDDGKYCSMTIIGQTEYATNDKLYYTITNQYYDLYRSVGVGIDNYNMAESFYILPLFKIKR